MNRRSLSAALLVLVVLGAQVVGLQRGYLCDGGGSVRLTFSDHCHGPHEHDCADSDHDPRDHDHHDHDEKDPVHKHPKQVETLQADTASAMSLSSDLVAVAQWIACDVAIWVQPPRTMAIPRPPPRDLARTASPWAERWVETIALRI